MDSNNETNKNTEAKYARSILRSVDTNIQKTLKKLYGNDIASFSKAIAEISAQKNSPSLPELNIGEIEQNKRELEAKTIAKEMQKVIDHIIQTQDDKAESKTISEHKLLWKIAVVTIVGTGVTAFLGTMLANYINQLIS